MLPGSAVRRLVAGRHGVPSQGLCALMSAPHEGTCAKEALHWGMAPSSMQELLEGWIPLGCRNYGVKITVLAGVLWTLWNVRDKMTIEGVFLSSPSVVIFKFDSFIQRWRRLL